MRELETQEAQGIFDELPKKEALRLRHELEKLQKNLGGIGDLTRRPDAIFVIDTRKEEIAVKEARKLGVPIIAVVDTNCDPDVVDFVIPGNDDAIRSGSLLARVIADAVAAGLGARPPEVIAAAEAAAASGVTYTAGGEEPPAEWEIMLAQEEAEKVRRAKEEMVPEEGPAATLSRRWRSRTRSASSTLRSGSPAWAPSAAWRPRSYRPAATRSTSSPPFRCPAPSPPGAGCERPT